MKFLKFEFDVNNDDLKFENDHIIEIAKFENRNFSCCFDNVFQRVVKIVDLIVD